VITALGVFDAGAVQTDKIKLHVIGGDVIPYFGGEETRIMGVEQAFALMLNRIKEALLAPIMQRWEGGYFIAIGVYDGEGQRQTEGTVDSQFLLEELDSQKHLFDLFVAVNVQGLKFLDCVAGLPHEEVFGVEVIRMGVGNEEVPYGRQVKLKIEIMGVGIGGEVKKQFGVYQCLTPGPDLPTSYGPSFLTDGALAKQSGNPFRRCGSIIVYVHVFLYKRFESCSILANLTPGLLFTLHVHLATIAT
jgi:hypothetical protein